MLTALQVRNYVLIDSLDITFPEGLVIITGQTGAGKSILLGAMSLVLGGRADVSAIASGADSCIVEAQFEVDPEDSFLKNVFDENDLDWDGGHIIIRRNVSRNGRSRSFVNDVPVTLPVLACLSSRLLDIHSQHQNLLLTDHAFQLSLIDRFAGNGRLLDECRRSWDSLNSLRRELSSVTERIDALERDREYNEARWNQLNDAALVDGELEALEEEQKRLANAEDIKTLLCECESIAQGGEDDSSLPLTSSLKEMRKRLDSLSRFIPSASSLSSRIDSCRLELEDIVEEVSRENSSLDVSPERLQQVDDRISTIYSLMRKYSCGSVAELMSVRDSLAGNLSDVSDLVFRKEQLVKEIAAAEKSYRDISAALSDSRRKACSPFSDAISSSLRFLELPDSCFDVLVSPASASASGTDSVMFRFSAQGREPVDVAKCASGGEMSRIMLALKDMMAKLGNMPTMIFDEIDTGVSGSVADRMGTMICGMGDSMQVFAITHLPQVAAKGRAHYLVSKDTDESGRTVSKITKLSDEQRVLELARMLSGASLTEAAVANARALLGY